MHCPACSGASSVIESRPHVSGGVRRRRQCDACGKRWTTLEVEAEQVEMITKLAKLARLADSLVETKPKKSKRHGIIVPPDLEADWKVLKRNSYNDFEAARALGLSVPENAS